MTHGLACWETRGSPGRVGRGDGVMRVIGDKSDADSTVSAESGIIQTLREGKRVH